MNWGKGIFIALGTFVVFIGVLATTLMRQNVDLVSEKYYVDEIAYQQEIDAIKSAQVLDSLIISQRDNQLVFQFDQNLNADSIALHLWRPNNDKLDQNYSISGTTTYLVPVTELEKGQYDVRCVYWKEGKNYLQKTSVKVN